MANQLTDWPFFAAKIIQYNMTETQKLLVIINLIVFIVIAIIYAATNKNSLRRKITSNRKIFILAIFITIFTPIIMTFLVKK